MWHSLVYLSAASVRFCIQRASFCPTNRQMWTLLWSFWCKRMQIQELIDTTAFLFKWNYWPSGKKKYTKHKEAWDHGPVKKCLHFCSHSWPVSMLFVNVCQIRPKQSRCERAPRFSQWVRISKAAAIFVRLFHQFSECLALCYMTQKEILKKKKIT